MVLANKTWICSTATLLHCPMNFQKVPKDSYLPSLTPYLFALDFWHLDIVFTKQAVKIQYKLGKKNPGYQTGNFKLENVKNQAQINRQVFAEAR